MLAILEFYMESMWSQEDDEIKIGKPNGGTGWQPEPGGSSGFGENAEVQKVLWWLTSKTCWWTGSRG